MFQCIHSIQTPKYASQLGVDCLIFLIDNIDNFRDVQWFLGIFQNPCIFIFSNIFKMYPLIHTSR